MNTSKIFVGNLSYNTSEDDLRQFFGQYGQVTDIKIIIDRDSGRSKGFGFVSFGSNQEGEKALAANQAELDGRQLNVSTARERAQR